MLMDWPYNYYNYFKNQFYVVLAHMSEPYSVHLDAFECTCTQIMGLRSQERTGMHECEQECMSALASRKCTSLHKS